MKSFKTKVCGITNPTNLKGVLTSYPDYVGIIHYAKSKRHVQEGDFRTLLNQIDCHIKSVLVVVNHDLQDIIRLLYHYPFDFIQLHGDEDLDYCQALKAHLTKPQSPMSHGSKPTKIIKAFPVDTSFDFKSISEFESVTDLFLFDTKGKLKGGNGTQFDWSILSNYTGQNSFLLSGGIGPNDVENIKSFAHSKLIGIDLNSGFESAPGIKDIQTLQEFKNTLGYV